MENLKASKIFGLAVAASAGWHIGKYVGGVADSAFLCIIKRMTPDVYAKAFERVK